MGPDPTRWLDSLSSLEVVYSSSFSSVPDFVELVMELLVLHGLLVRRQRFLLVRRQRVHLQPYGQFRQQDVPDTGRKIREVQAPASPSGDTV
ncbi:hypothetical protein DPMN_002011 [Dreissena polymorpha]|uniref:Uncharacterized protein n=1 Tax=Dreissena polymorpha TaxID=45954 RepID=A0A9D4MMT6_DREPO|nr:hypothetical protein DPMN_002011 [Dreissena polymorpha]